MPAIGYVTREGEGFKGQLKTLSIRTDIEIIPNGTKAADTLLALQQIVRFADELPVAIWVGRVPSGECVYVNQAFRRVLGIDPPEGAARGNYAGPYSVHTPDGEPYPESAMP